ncbi:hypothetical protein [Nocardioides coralli]|uniref:hypothetical protein n=1 Tax=Nocardioides coralli TaxID=2872154 RepID=UPI001CA3D17F|nr:hypothetical protein [Nocardioides coralli]QZY30040.1 hypothetical protein K6T13_04975 [Nocardioides coralli]
MRRGGFPVLACLLGLWLGGCGDDAGGPAEATGSESTSASGSPSSVPEGPACDEVWVDGADLPRSYRGCVQDDAWVKAATSRCASGQVLVTYGDRFYGAKGAVVNDVGGPLDDSNQYRRAVRSCG